MTSPFAVTRILCPTDFSPGSKAAIAAADVLATRLGARVELLHVWSPAVTVMLDAAIIPTPDQVVAQVTALENALAADAKNLSLPADRVERHLVQGTNAWRDVVDFATAKGFDLIVMSTHGRTGLAHLVMGSVTERVVRTSPIPVLVIPTDR